MLALIKRTIRYLRRNKVEEAAVMEAIANAKDSLKWSHQYHERQKVLVYSCQEEVERKQYLLAIEVNNTYIDHYNRALFKLQTQLRVIRGEDPDCL